MHCYPQFSFWILKALAKIYFFHSLKPRKHTFVLVGEYLGPDLRCTEHVRSNKRRHRP